MAVIIEPQKGKFEFKIGAKSKTFSLPKFSELPVDFVREISKAAQENPEIADSAALIVYADFIKENNPGIEKYPLTISVVGQIVNEWMKDSGVDMGELQASSN